MEAYTITRVEIFVNIWRFLFDKQNRNVRKVILPYVEHKDYYNLWAALFRWPS